MGRNYALVKQSQASSLDAAYFLSISGVDSYVITLYTHFRARVTIIHTLYQVKGRGRKAGKCNHSFAFITCSLDMSHKWYSSSLANKYELYSSLVFLRRPCTGKRVQIGTRYNPYSAGCAKNTQQEKSNHVTTMDVGGGRHREQKDGGKNHLRFAVFSNLSRVAHLKTIPVPNLVKIFLSFSAHPPPPPPAQSSPK